MSPVQKRKPKTKIYRTKEVVRFFSTSECKMNDDYWQTMTGD